VDILVIVLATIILTVAWAVFWALRLWRKWQALWAAVTELFGVLDEGQRLLDSASADVALLSHP
jgi:hypothetical protein